MAKSKGPGFDQLFTEGNTPPSGAFPVASMVQQVVKKAKSRVGRVSLDRLRPNPKQQRKVFDQQDLIELGDSIETHGLLQPLVIRESEIELNMFDIAAGERRWRAMQLKGMIEADAVILDAQCTDDEMEEIALIENVQRVNLSPFELATGYMKLHKDENGTIKHSITEIAQIVKKSPNVIDDYLAIIRAPQKVRQLIIDDPQHIAIRTIRDLSNVENEQDLDYLIEEVRAGGLKANDVSRILRDVRREQQGYSTRGTGRKTSSTQKSIQEEQGISKPLSSVSEEESSQERTVTTLVQKKRPSPAVALASLEQKLRRDQVEIQKVFTRITEDVPFMSVEEKKRVQEFTNGLIEQSTQLLHLAQVEAEQ